MAEEKNLERKPTSTRVVGMLSAIYYRQQEDPVTGKTVRGPVVANWGEEIELTEDEERRLEKNGALLPAGSKAADAQAHHERRIDAYRAERGDQEALQRHYARLAQAREEGSGDIVDVSIDSDTSVTELAEQIRERKPSAEDTVNLAEGDRGKAERVLEAERSATGGSPRPGVERGLRKIIEGEKQK